MNLQFEPELRFLLFFKKKMERRKFRKQFATGSAAAGAAGAGSCDAKRELDCS